jgi:hypothetical protein
MVKKDNRGKFHPICSDCPEKRKKKKKKKKIGARTYFRDRDLNFRDAGLCHVTECLIILRSELECLNLFTTMSDACEK